ncbi:cytochrome P450 [Dictyobacter alpinus]|uniref:Cytochrome P450 n=2 Tax=Dictyobacter alpinus TaxID=2014873 RepID=A0A402BGG4_9CHLR|nr:cytochrome P450 [Dictyobacter alpinus]
MATVYLGRVPLVFLFKPEYVRYVLVEHPRNFTSREISQPDETTASEGLLTIDGEKHRQQRRAVQPAFHKKQVEGYASAIMQYTQEAISSWHIGDSVDLTQSMQELTLRIIGKCLFGVDFASQLEALGKTFDDMIGSQAGILDTVFNLRIDNPVTAYGKRLSAMRKLNMSIYTLIAERRSDPTERNDVLSLLLKTEDGVVPGQLLSDKQIHDHILTFIAAGHETTAISLAWTFYLLSEHPHIRAKLQEELRTVLGDRPPTLEDIPKLTYTDWVLSESMRLYPPAWIQGRFAVDEFELDGVRFPAGTRVMMSQWIMHRLPEIWKDPLVFRPERWDPEHGQQVPPGAYFPFGGGPRTCIGMPLAQLEGRLILAMVMQRFQPEMPAGFQPGFNPVITLRPKHNLKARLMPVPTRDEASAAERRVLVSSMHDLSDRKGCRTALFDWLSFFRL